MASIIKEGKKAYINNLNKPYKKLIKKENMSFGAEQLIKLYLEMFFIHIVRSDALATNKERLSFGTKERMEEDIINNIIEYLKENIYINLSFDEICIRFSMGKTHLKTAFKKATNQGVVTYFRILKIEEAKRMIREGKYNFTEIAEKLGYDSVHYFSRCFKKCTDMTPSQYASSVKAFAQI